MKAKRLFFFSVIVFLTIIIAGCTQQQYQPQASVQTPQPTGVQPSYTIGTNSSSLGTILVDNQGKTLYYFAMDTPGSNNSSCYGQCAVYWPVFFVDPITVPSSLSVTEFSSITRDDGSKQTTFRGWPLYYYKGDKNIGDVNGENVTNNWFVVRPDETVMISQKKNLGLFLTDRSGRTLYYFAKDTPMVSTCTDSCLTKWPDFSAEPPVAPSILKPSDFSAISRPDGMKQTAFMGRPLYYYSGDTMPGDVNGQGFNGVWFVANVSGVMPAAPVTQPANMPQTVMPTPKQTTTPSSSGSYGGYGSGY